MTIPPRPAHTHTWDGHTLPTWISLDQHSFDNGELVVHTPDGHARPRPGWTLIAWTDGTITVASPWTGQHVYGPVGAYQQLAQTEAQLRQIRRLRDDLNDTTGAPWTARALDTILNPQETP